MWKKICNVLKDILYSSKKLQDLFYNCNMQVFHNVQAVLPIGLLQLFDWCECLADNPKPNERVTNGKQTYMPFNC